MTVAHASAVLAIYQAGIDEGNATFETYVPDWDTFTGPAGTFRQRTELTKPQRDLLAKLAITPPKQIVQLEPA